MSSGAAMVAPPMRLQKMLIGQTNLNEMNCFNLEFGLMMNSALVSSEPQAANPRLHAFRMKT